MGCTLVVGFLLSGVPSVFGNQNYASQDTSYTEDNQKLRNYTYKSIYTPLKGTNDAYRIKYIIVDSESKTTLWIGEKFRTKKST
ncbi:hypothetical protein J0835_04175 [Bacillus cereus group sp. Sample62]|nr:hypothetical protein [Bacillus mobilis]EEL89390.1 hypothetical protein bcere0029_6880 [Bacillus cereus AH1272]EKS7862086.1 hypothetical protein [Bacillus cereus]HDX9550026.1 hypothetical protein [Bacillus thuringiensis]MBL3740211.1 hypothetical protein [Bacillus cereus]MBL3862836.1 hypothetical protein [Bacillus cereus]